MKSLASDSKPFKNDHRSRANWEEFVSHSRLPNNLRHKPQPMQNLASEPVLSYIHVYANSLGYGSNLPVSRKVHHFGGRGQIWAFISCTGHIWRKKKRRRKTMKQHQTDQTLNRNTEVFLFTSSVSGRQSRRAVLGEQVLQKRQSPDLDLQWLVSPKVLSPATL